MMAEQNVNPLALLGRLLTFIGAVWFGVVFLSRIGLFSELGVGDGFFAPGGNLAGLTPALILLVVGRALRRRAKAAQDQSSPVPVPVEPTVGERRVPTSRTEASTPILTPPRVPEITPAPTPPVRSPTPSPPVPRQVDPLPPPSTALVPEKSPAPDPETSPSIAEQVAKIKKAGSAKTSKEMVEEAHKRWGRGRTG